MNSRKVFLWACVAVVASFAVGVRVGAELGVVQFAHMDSAAKASVLTHELRALRAGIGGKLIQTKEMEVDGAVVNAIKFQEQGMPWLFWPLSADFDHERSLRRVAKYRKEFPPVVPTVAPPAGSPDPADLRLFGAEVERATQKLLERYGK